jgi:integrase
MPVDDMWYRKQRGPDGERLKAKRHGKGKRWRCRYMDANGEPRARFFERKTDAEAFDVKARAGLAEEARTEQHRLTFRAYGERWRLAREVGVAPETRRRVEGNLRLHLYPTFASRAIRAIRPTDVLEWLTEKVKAGTPKNSIRLYFDVLRTVLNAARADKVIADNPTEGIDLAQFLRGLSRVPKWVPTAEQVAALLPVVPARYRAAIWLGAGEALRISEVLGVENSPRCADFLRREFHVVQQLRYGAEHGGFYLTVPKSGSSGTLDLDPDVATALAEHIREFPPVGVEIVDLTSGRPERRTVPLMFTNERGGPISDKRWSEMWARWRAAAGWPDDAGFHALRHFSATTLITAGVEPQAVQRHLRHASLKITLETYVGYWPRSERSRGLVGAALRAAGGRDGREIAGA